MVRCRASSFGASWLPRVREGVASFLGAIHRHDARRHHVRIANQVRRQLFVNGLGIELVSGGNRARKPARRHLADGEMHAASDERIKRHAAVWQSAEIAARVVDVQGGFVFVFGLSKFPAASPIAALYFAHIASENANPVELCRSTMTTAASALPRP